MSVLKAESILLLLLLSPFQQAYLFGLHRTNVIRNRANEKEVVGGRMTSDDYATANNATNAEDTSTLLPSLWHQQAQALRQEISDLQQNVARQKQARLVKARTDVDRWIAQALVRCQVDADTTVLNTVDETVEILCQQRYSPEQVYKMFYHLSETTTSNKRSKISPTLELLVEAAGKMDAMEREDNPNKRWSGRIEADFRKRLFARDWGIELEDKDFSGGRW